MSLPPSQQPWLFPLSLIGWRWAPKPQYRLKLRRRKKFSLKRACNSDALSHAAVGADPRHRPTLEGGSTPTGHKEKCTCGRKATRRWGSRDKQNDIIRDLAQHKTNSHLHARIQGARDPRVTPRPRPLHPSTSSLSINLKIAKKGRGEGGE